MTQLDLLMQGGSEGCILPGGTVDPQELCVLCSLEPRVGTGLMCSACGLKATATVARKGKTR